MQLTKFRILSAITASAVTLAVVAAITVGSGTSHAAQPAALAVKADSWPPVNLDACPTLHTGYPTGGCVAELQNELNLIAGSTIVNVDGAFGPQTYNAVKAFQQSKGLTQDGMVGPDTKKALDAALSVPTPRLPAVTPATGGGTTSTPSSTGERLCKGWGGVLNNVFGAGIGSLSPAILGKAQLGTPYLDGNVVRADSSVPFYSWGSCGNQVEFQMQSWVCGFWGCEWVTRDHGTPEFFWAHDDTGVVSHQVTMGCRKGTHSYRVHMQVVGLSSTGDASTTEGQPDANGTEGQSDANGGEGVKGAAGVEVENETEDGPTIQLTC